MIKIMERDEILKFWYEIDKSIQEILPEHEYYNSAKFMQIALDGKAQIWMILGDEKNPLKGIMTTMLVTNPITGSRVLHVYSLNTDGTVSRDEWIENFAIVGKYAQDMGCRRIEAVTYDQKVIKLVEDLGGDLIKYSKIIFKV